MNNFRTAVIALTAGVAVASLPVNSSRASPNLVTNGGFETGNTSGWSLTGDTSFTGVNFSPNVHTGCCALDFGEVNGDGVLTQSIATQAGHEYFFSFWLANDGGNPNDFTAKWNGASELSLINAPGFGYTHFVYDVTATGASSTIEFDAFQQPAWYHLDDVAVKAPEPATLGILSVALAGFGLFQRRRRG